MKTHLLFLLFAALAVAGCDREEPGFPGTIAGRTLNIATRQPVPGAEIHLRLMDKCYNHQADECWTVIGTAISDADGYFSIDYVTPSEDIREALLAVKGYKEGFFVLSDAGSYITLQNDSTIVDFYPKTYLRVRIEDEYPYDYSKYVGMKLSHTTFAPWDTVMQFPLDTTIIMEANPVIYSNGANPLIYALVYDRPNTLGSIMRLPSVICPAFDTCDVEIRF